MLFVTHQQLKSRRRNELGIINSCILLLSENSFYNLFCHIRRKRFMAKCKRNRNKDKRDFTIKTLTANRNSKDTVFRMLFSDRKNLLSLYNAVNQRDYKNPEDLEIVTLENAIYMGIKNELSFIMDTNMYLYQHQSTYNPNKPQCFTNPTAYTKKNSCKDTRLCCW